MKAYFTPLLRCVSGLCLVHCDFADAMWRSWRHAVSLPLSGPLFLLLMALPCKRGPCCWAPVAQPCKRFPHYIICVCGISACCRRGKRTWQVTFRLSLASCWELNFRQRLRRCRPCCGKSRQYSLQLLPVHPNAIWHGWLANRGTRSMEKHLKQAFICGLWKSIWLKVARCWKFFRNFVRLK